MKTADFNRLALYVLTAASLLGCGGSQAQLPPSGITPEQPQAKAEVALTSRAFFPDRGFKGAQSLLYVTNYDSNTVTVYPALSKDPAPLAVISVGLSTPSGDCIDGHGTLYVTNQPLGGDGWISEYPLGSTSPSKIVKDGAAQPAFCAIDAKGNLWVTNLAGPNVTEYLYGSKKPHEVITAGLTFPVGIAIDHFGNLYVANGWGAPQQNIEVYASGSTSPSRTITEGITRPVGIAVDSKAALYVPNVDQNNIEEYRAGQSLPFQTITEAMNDPTAATVDARGRLFVANYGNNVVLEFPSGSLTPSKREIKKGLYTPESVAHYPPLLP